MITKLPEQSADKEMRGVDNHQLSLLSHARCRRCDGLLINDHCIDLEDGTGQIDIVVRRCVQCGDVIDPTILRNRLHPESVVKTTTSRRVWPKPQGLRQRGTQQKTVDPR